MKFNEQLAFLKYRERLHNDELIDEEPFKTGKGAQGGGKSIRAITDKLNSNRCNVSKQVFKENLNRKVSQSHKPRECATIGQYYKSQKDKRIINLLPFAIKKQ